MKDEKDNDGYHKRRFGDDYRLRVFSAVFVVKFIWRRLWQIDSWLGQANTEIQKDEIIPNHNLL
jgi:hypothetical protein